MARKIIVLCDADHSEGTEAPGHIVDIVIRVTDPDNPSAARRITGSLEICPEHQAPVAALGRLLEQHGAPLTKEARTLLCSAVNGPGASADKTPGSSDRIVCMECSPPKVLKTTSLWAHADRIHDKKSGEIPRVPFDPAEHGSLAGAP